jgi:copper chaperone CopZ
MNGKQIFSATAMLLLTVFIASSVRTAGAWESTTRLTTVVVKDMHCAACANKIAAKLYAVPGVVEVRADVKRNVTFIGPREDRMPSPRAMWEAIEAAGFKPVQMIGPEGRFTSKPVK